MDQTQRLLRRCTVTIGGLEDPPLTNQGTGFFVAPRLIVTSHHVAPDSDGEAIKVRWQDKDLIVSIVGESDKSHADLLLLRVTSPRIAHPSVCLNSRLAVRDVLWVYGYPTGAYRGGDPRTFDYDGEALRHGTELLTVAHGQAVSGFSGAPVMNLRTGGVCGVMRFTRSEVADLGARLVPIEAIETEFPQVVRAQGRLRRKNTRWLSTLSRNQLIAGSWPFPSRELQSYVSVSREVWSRLPRWMEELGVNDRAELYVAQELANVAPAPRSGDEEPRVSGDLGATPLEAKVRASGPVYGAGADAFNWTRRCTVITGPPGVGKSSLLAHLARITGRALVDEDHVAQVPYGLRADVPVLAPARALVKTGAPLGTALYEVVRASLGAAARDELPTDLFTGPPMAEASWLVLVDGLDEVIDPDSRKELVRNVARHLGDTKSPHRFVIATRPLPAEELTLLRARDTAELVLRAFDTPRVAAFVRRWFAQTGGADGDADVFLDRLKDAPPDLVSTPLFLTILLQLHHRDQSAPLPHSRVDLFEQFVEELINGRMADGERQLVRTKRALREAFERLFGEDGAANEREVDRLVARLREVLESLAFTRTQQARERESLLDVAIQELPPPRFASNDPDWESVIRMLLIRSGLLVESVDGLTFGHDLIREYLAACHLARAWRPDEPDIKNWIDRELWSGRQQSTVLVLALWGRRGEDIAALISWMAHHTPRAAISACLVLAETSDEAHVAPDIVPRLLDLARVKPYGSAEFDGAIEALAGLSNRPEVVAGLVDLLGDPQAWSEWGIGVSLALARLGEGDTAADWLRTATLAHLGDRDWTTMLALQGLVKLGGTREVISALREHVAEADAGGRLWIAEALETLGDTEASSALRQQELSDTSALTAESLDAAADMLVAREPQLATDLYLAAIRAPGPLDRAWVANQLIQLGEARRAAEALRAWVRSGSGDDHTVVRAFDSLGDAAGEVCAELAAASGSSPAIRARAERYARSEEARARLTGAREDMARGLNSDAVAKLQAVCSQSWAAPWMREEAVRLLADLRNTPRARETLRELAKDPAVGARCRLEAANALVGLGLIAPAIDALRSLAVEAARNPEIGIKAAHRLNELGESAAAVSALAEAIDGEVEPSVAVSLTRALVDLDQRQAVIKRLVTLAVDRAVPFHDRMVIITDLALLGERAQAIESLQSVVLDRTAFSSDRVQAARSLFALGEPATALGALREIVASGTSGFEVGEACVALAGLEEREWACEALISKVRDPEFGTEGRLQAARSLLDLGAWRTAAPLLCELAVAADTMPDLRLYLAEQLKDLGDAASALQIFQTLAHTPQTPAIVRVDAAAQLAMNGDVDTASGVLTPIAQNPSEDNTLREYAVALLDDPHTKRPSFLPFYLEPANRDLRSNDVTVAEEAAGDPDSAIPKLLEALTPSGFWFFDVELGRLTLIGAAARAYRAARELDRLGRRKQAVGELLKVATSAATPSSSRIDAAKVLAQLGEIDTATQLLAALAANVDADDDARLDAEATLLELDSGAASAE
jgi:tetratricopeptide (TPR) repeat protein